jgi:hypothetical protein
MTPLNGCKISELVWKYAYLLRHYHGIKPP